MSETAPLDQVEPGPAFMGKPTVKKRGRKQKDVAGVNRKTPNLSVSKLITEALLVSPQRTSMSLVALKKTLAAAGYDVNKNNSRIKVVLKSLVRKGTLVQTKGSGASGSFKLSKKAAAQLTNVKSKRTASTKSKKLALSRESKTPKNTKSNKTAQKPRATAAQKAARGVWKAAGAKGKPPRKSPAKARAGKPRAGRAPLTQQRANPRKGAPKK
ncbi:histone H1t [Pteronotus mesoamericanus]|uniref:histone H1t n=1 Tax=Pteronotus mesoamericanus TaxID=1884717 RepID=UPI0023EA7B59|nr:histone H1t [Pteronotus parnellii mesoamericanus]